MYVNQAFSPVLVVLRSHRSLMPQRRRITIRRQSGGGPLHLPRFIRDLVADARRVPAGTGALPCQSVGAFPRSFVTRYR